jgi:hypothetical protein
VALEEVPEQPVEGLRLGADVGDAAAPCLDGDLAGAGDVLGDVAGGVLDVEDGAARELESAPELSDLRGVDLGRSPAGLFSGPGVRVALSPWVYGLVFGV